MAELLFAAECCKHGLTVCFPHSDSISYDFVVDNGKNLLRVQVKSSSSTNKQGLSQFVMHINDYKSHKIDLYALYCYLNNSFYIIPSSKVKSDSVYASKRNEVYKNAWHLFKK